MKTKMILSAIVIAAALFVIGVTKAQKLKTIDIRQQVLIHGSIDEVFDQIVYLKNFPNWSPFLEADPSQEIEIKGEDGKVGAQYHWIGNKGKDVGYQEIKMIRPAEYVKMECDIQKPFKARPVFEYHLRQVEGQVQVTQDFHLTSGRMDAFFMWLFRAKKDMEKMNARGMELLKLAVEDGQL